MRKDGFFAEVLRAVVAQQKKRARENSPDYFLNQKKQLWYFLMNAVDGDAEAQDAPAQPGEK